MHTCLCLRKCFLPIKREMGEFGEGLGGCAGGRRHLPGLAPLGSLPQPEGGGGGDREDQGEGGVR